MKLAIALLLVLSTSSVFAADPTPPAREPNADDNKEYVVTPKAVIKEDSSEHNRIDKQHQINAIIFGVGPSLSSTLGLQYGYFLDRNRMIIIEGTNGRLGFGTSMDAATGYDYTIKTKSLGAHFKHFTGNSFYYRAGLDVRTVDYAYVDRSSTTDFVNFDATSLAANFQIGNQWQWSSFTLGCDWLGLSVPITSSVKNKQVGASTPSYISDDDDENLLVEKTHINFLRFYLGASF